MRGLALLLLVASAHLSSAVPGLIEAGGPIANRARAEGMFRMAPQGKPTEAGLPTFLERPLPQPRREVEGQFRLYEAREALREGDRVEASGGVRFSFRGYDVLTEYALGDLRTEEFLLRGNVRVIGTDQSLTGQEVYVDFRNERASFANGAAVLGPGFVGGNVRSEIVLRAAFGGGTREQVDAQQCELTTCILPEPHFHFAARSADIRPGARAVLRHVTLVVLGRKLMHLPYIAFPLDDYSDRYIPEVGQSPDEGYFVKSKWPAELARGIRLDTRVDYMTKLGAGLGGDLDYAFRGGRGLFRLYGITGGPGTVTSSLQHRQRLAGDLSVDASLQRSNYQTAPGVQTATLRASYAPNWTNGTTRLGYNVYATRSLGFTSHNETYMLQDSRRLSRHTTTSLNVNYAISRSGQVFRRQIDVNFRGAQELRAATASLEFQRTIPVGAIQNFFGSADRTPILSLSSDSRRLLGDAAGRRLPFRAELSWGELKDTLRRRPISRTALDLDFQPTRGRDGGLSWDGRFRQGLYSDDTAQYVLANNVGFVERLGRDTEVSLRHAYLRPYGYTPLSVDRSGETNLFSLAASYRPIRSLRVSGETAYDLVSLQRNEPAWQSINLRADWRPHERFQLRAQANYDSARERWTNVRWDFGWSIAGGFVSAGARYDAQRHTWANVNLLAEGLRWGRLSTSVLLAFNGYTERFEARHFSFIYDLHCAEAILQVIDNPVGFRRGTEIGFFIRIKALPFQTPFGAGRRGQAIGTGTGLGF